MLNEVFNIVSQIISTVILLVTIACLLTEDHKTKLELFRKIRFQITFVLMLYIPFSYYVLYKILEPIIK